MSNIDMPAATMGAGTPGQPMPSGDMTSPQGMPETHDETPAHGEMPGSAMDSGEGVDAGGQGRRVLVELRVGPSARSAFSAAASLPALCAAARALRRPATSALRSSSCAGEGRAASASVSALFSSRSVSTSRALSRAAFSASSARSCAARGAAGAERSSVRRVRPARLCAAALARLPWRAGRRARRGGRRRQW